MELSSGQYLQLILALAFGVLAFVGAYSLKERVAVAGLVIFIPFQPVMSSFGSINMVAVYLIAVSFLLKRRILFYPLLSWTITLLFIYVLSLILASGYARMDNMFYIISIVSNFLLFYIVLNYVYKTGEVKQIVRYFIIGNVFVVGYCLIQLAVGVDKFAPFGVTEFMFERNRADGRLMGPFNATGITAEYLVIQIFLLLYQIMHDTKKFWRRLSIGILLADLAFLVMTGNRTGIIVLVGGAILFAYLFRKELGMKKIIAGAVVSIAGFIMMSVIVIMFSQFNVLFDRFADTEVRDGVVDSRSKIWPLAMERIMEKPVLGHGPRIRLIDEDKRAFPRGYKFMPHPHSMYLFIWYTLGISGLMVYLGYFIRQLLYYFSVRRNGIQDNYLKYMPRIAIVVWFIIMVDQAKVSAFRYAFSDYQHYLFAIFGMMLGMVMYIRKQKKYALKQSVAK